MRPFLKFARAVDRLNDGIGSFIRWLVLAMILVGAYNALARWLSQYAGMPLSSNALFELQWYMFSIVFLMGAAYGFRHDVHVRVDILYAKQSPTRQAWIDLFGTILFLIPFSIVMLWIATPSVLRSWQTLEVSPDPGGLPRYPIKALVLVSFALLVLQGLAQVVRQVEIIRGAARGAEPVSVSQASPPEPGYGDRHAPGTPAGPDEPDTRHGEGL